MDWLRQKQMEAVIYNNQKDIKQRIQNLISNKFSSIPNPINKKSFSSENSFNKLLSLIDKFRANLQSGLDTYSSEGTASSIRANSFNELGVSKIEYSYNAIMSFIQNQDYRTFNDNQKKTFTSRLDDLLPMINNYVKIALSEKSPYDKVITQMYNNIKVRNFTPIKFDAERNQISNAVVEKSLRGSKIVISENYEYIISKLSYIEELILQEQTHQANLGANYDDEILQKFIEFKTYAADVIRKYEKNIIKKVEDLTTTAKLIKYREQSEQVLDAFKVKYNTLVNEVNVLSILPQVSVDDYTTYVSYFKSYSDALAVYQDAIINGRNVLQQNQDDYDDIIQLPDYDNATLAQDNQVLQDAADALNEVGSEEATIRQAYNVYYAGDFATDVNDLQDIETRLSVYEKTPRTKQDIFTALKNNSDTIIARIQQFYNQFNTGLTEIQTKLDNFYAKNKDFGDLIAKLDRETTERAQKRLEQEAIAQDALHPVEPENPQDVLDVIDVVEEDAEEPALPANPPNPEAADAEDNADGEGRKRKPKKNVKPKAKAKAKGKKKIARRFV